MICFRISAVSTNVAIIPNTSLHNPVVIPLKFLHIFCAKRTGHCQAFLWDSCWILGILMPSFQNPSFCYGFASLASETASRYTCFWYARFFEMSRFSWDFQALLQKHVRIILLHMVLICGMVGHIYWYFQAWIFFDTFRLWCFLLFFDIFRFWIRLWRNLLYFSICRVCQPFLIREIFDTFWYVFVPPLQPNAKESKKQIKTYQYHFFDTFWYEIAFCWDGRAFSQKTNQNESKTFWYVF